MLTRIFWIDELIGVMPKPNGGAALIDEVRNWQKLNIKTVVSLLEKEEVAELGLKDEGKQCSNVGIEFISFPIKDRGLPSKDLEVRNLVDVLSRKIESKEKLVVHCRAGIGRSGIIAASILMKQGMDYQEAVKKIRGARNLSIPDTDEQLNWLKNLKLRT